MVKGVKGTGEERGRKGTEEPSQIHSAVGLRRIDRAVVAQLVRNINVNGRNMRPIRSQFHSRPNTPTSWLSPSDQNRAATPRVSSPPLSRLLQICIPLSERECVRQPETMRGSYSRSSNSVLLKLGYARINP